MAVELAEIAKPLHRRTAQGLVASPRPGWFRRAPPVWPNEALFLREGPSSRCCSGTGQEIFGDSVALAQLGHRALNGVDEMFLDLFRSTG
ncbi:hypothetical protein AB0F17_02040 [Nonomuraea sp. NPDC026600]|uniref:hypothetical protein n=1 Tax=Nonomuraea sp. NPDC026600 TaxID=3155363 RepID=UPI0033F3F84C